MIDTLGLGSVSVSGSYKEWTFYSINLLEILEKIKTQNPLFIMSTQSPQFRGVGEVSFRSRCSPGPSVLTPRVQSGPGFYTRQIRSTSNLLVSKRVCLGQVSSVPCHQNVEVSFEFYQTSLNFRSRFGTGCSLNGEGSLKNRLNFMISFVFMSTFFFRCPYPSLLFKCFVSIRYRIKDRGGSLILEDTHLTLKQTEDDGDIGIQDRLRDVRRTETICKQLMYFTLHYVYPFFPKEKGQKVSE